MTLPLTRHRPGRAAPLPGAAPEPPPAAPPSPQPEAAGPARVVIPDDRSDNPDTATVLTGDVTAQDIAAAAGRHHRAAGLARDQAGRDQAEADRIMADARAQVARIMRSAEEASSVLSKSAAQAARQAEALAGRARSLAAAAAETAKADGAQARAGDLAAERERLAAAGAELDGRLAALAAERGHLAAQLSAARESGDLDALAALRGRDSAAADMAASLAAQKDAALARVAEIGEPDWPHHPKPPLAEALQVAEGARLSARRTLNAVWPGRPEAVADAQRTRMLALIDGQQDRLAGQGAGQSRPRQQVYLG